MADRYWKSPTGVLGRSENDSVSYPSDWVEISEAEYSRRKDEKVTAAQQAEENRRASKEADARAVYDEIFEIHPITALTLAKMIYPEFSPEGP